MLGPSSSSTRDHQGEEDPSPDLSYHININLNIPRPPPLPPLLLGSSTPHPPRQPPPLPLRLPAPAPPLKISSSVLHDPRQVLISCAELVSLSDFTSACHLLSLLSGYSSPSGDSSMRLLHQFSMALRLRLERLHLSRAAAGHSTGNIDIASAAAGAKSDQLQHGRDHRHYLAVPFDHALVMPSAQTTSPTPTTISPVPAATGSTTTVLDDHDDDDDSRAFADEWNEKEEMMEAAEAVRSSYLSLNQVTPFIRFCHLTANQAILEAVDGYQAVHVLDLDVMHGVQWPPLMQAVAQQRPRPPSLRITGAGRDPDLLRSTGDRLRAFAESLGLPSFQFHPLLLLLDDDHDDAMSYMDDVVQQAEEALAVNCMHYMHRLLRDPPHEEAGCLRLFLRRIKAMNPKVVTVAEREGRHGSPVFLERFREGLDHYAAIFDSLEATLPPQSRERLGVEQVWLGREIRDIVAAEGDKRRERHQGFESWWDPTMRSCGFSNVPLSAFNLSQAKLLLRLHYPSEGYQLRQIENNQCLFLGWQKRDLFSVSSWR